jgi:predicted ATPase/DNA-binding SARP family transcriptional activator
MRLCVLGPVEVSVDGRRSPLGSERQRAIVAVLLAAGGEVVSADRLVDGLWGSRAPAGARKALQTHVSRLRRMLAAIAPGGADGIVTASDGYRVDLTACESDAARFEELVAAAQRVKTTHPRKAAELLDEAQGLWRGAAFGELADHKLVRAEALRLEQLREAAAADDVDAQLALGRHEAVLGELEGRVASDPLAERAHAQLMLALYRSGRQAEALATYRRLQQRLGDEVGIDPAPELQELHERILRQDADLAAPDVRPRSSLGRSPGGAETGGERTLPASADSARDLVGRDEDVAAVASLVTAGSPVTLIGVGGVGKTRLAERVAAVVAEQFADGVAVCSLAAVRDPDSVAVALIDALGAQHQGGRPAEETLLAALGTRRLLLVLDNCEHLLAAVSQLVESIGEQCPNVSVLATSREALRLPGERVWQVAPLPVPRSGASAAEVGDAPAGALFLARARAAEPTFELTDGNAGTVGQLCRRLDGIPLAIELAAARVRAMAPSDLLARIDQRFSVLTGGPHREDGRHRTLHAVVEWSYELLDEAEALLFERLSVFAGSFTLAAAERVCAGEPIVEGEVAGVLAELVDKSMVVVDRDGGRVRYRLLDTLRDYGAARFAETGNVERYRHAHAAHHVAFVEAVGPRVRGADERTALTEIDAAVDDLRVAHAWLVATGDVDGALRLPVALRDYIGNQLRDEMVTWTERALALPAAPAHPAYPAALATAARGATRRGDLDRTRRYAEAALAEAEPSSLTVIWALHALATAALYEGRLGDALAPLDRATALADELGEDYYRAMTELLRVLVYLYRGDAGAAVVYARELSEAAERSGNHAMRAWALYGHGEALLDTDPAEAAALLEQAVEAAGAVDVRVPEGAALLSLASLCGRRGEVARALALFRDTIHHWRRLGDWTHQLTTLRNLVELLARVHVDEQVAALHGGVTAADPPSFGAEAERLEAAWVQLEQQLGADRARDAAARGRHLTAAEMIDEALATLDGLRAG